MLTSVRKTWQILNLFNFAKIWPPIICWLMCFPQVGNLKLFRQFCVSNKKWRRICCQILGYLKKLWICLKLFLLYEMLLGFECFFVNMRFHINKNAPSKNISPPPPIYSGDLRGAKLSIWHFYGPRLIYGRLRSTFMDLVVLYGLL